MTTVARSMLMDTGHCRTEDENNAGRRNLTTAAITGAPTPNWVLSPHINLHLHKVQPHSQALVHGGLGVRLYVRSYQTLIVCSMQKAIKNWRQEWSGNKYTITGL